jgi:hypothetical protein
MNCYFSNRESLMTSQIHITMHNQHRTWEKDVRQWRDDLEAWKLELVESQRDVMRLQEAMTNHAQALESHTAGLLKEEAEWTAHEDALAEYERGGAGAELLPMVAQHQDELSQHRNSRDIHEKLKRQHYAMMAHLRLLLNAFSEPHETATTKEPLLTIS